MLLLAAFVDRRVTFLYSSECGVSCACVQVPLPPLVYRTGCGAPAAPVFHWRCHLNDTFLKGCLGRWIGMTVCYHPLQGGGLARLPCCQKKAKAPASPFPYVDIVYVAACIVAFALGWIERLHASLGNEQPMCRACYTLVCDASVLRHEGLVLLFWQPERPCLWHSHFWSAGALCSFAANPTKV